MKLISMEKPAPKAKKGDKIGQDLFCGGGERYPYGLKLRFDEDAIKKLKLDVSSMKVGDTITIQAKASVEEVSQREGRDYSSGKPKTHESLELQITAIGLSSAKDYDGAWDEKDDD